MSAEATVPFSQKDNCKPQTIAARTGGTQAAGMDSNANALCSFCRCFSERSWGSKATEGVNKAKGKAAQRAAKKLGAKGTVWAGNQRNGKVTSQKTGAVNSGCQVQPDTLDTCCKLLNDTQ